MESALYGGQAPVADKRLNRVDALSVYGRRKREACQPRLIVNSMCKPRTRRRRSPFSFRSDQRFPANNPAAGRYQKPHRRVRGR